MIRRNRPVPVLWSVGILVLGVVASSGLWWLKFTNTYWGLPSGEVRILRPEYGVQCLYPWDPTDHFGCRQMFASIGYENLDKVSQYQMFVTAPWVVGLALVGFASWMRWFNPPWTQVITGFSVGDRTDLVRQAKKESGKKSLEVFPGYQITQQREVRSVIYLGAIGSGKTGMMLWYAKAVAQRGDPAIIFCQKDEWIGRTWAADDTPFILIAPHDARSAVWDIARDVVDEPSAIRLAQYLVAEEKGENRFFSLTARAVCTGMIMKLMSESGQDWGWGDLSDEVEQPLSELIEVAKTYYPPATNFLAIEPKQAESTHATLQAHLLQVRLLGFAWRDRKKRYRFSLRDYIAKRGEGSPKQVFVAHSGEFQQLSDAWITLFYEMAGDAVRSPDLAESSSERLYFFLDEFPQLPKIEAMDDLLMTGRSKGVVMVLGAQDMSQIIKVYGKETYQAWFSSIGTKVFGRHEVGPGSHEAAKLFGKTRIRDRKPTPVGNGGTYDPGDYREEEPFSAFDFENELNVHHRKWYKRTGLGTEQLVTGVGPILCKVLVPFYGLEDYRDRYKEAEWITHGRALMRQRTEMGDAISNLRPRGKDSSGFWDEPAE